MSGDSRTRWGRASVGSRRVSAMAVALPAGVASAAFVGVAAVTGGVAGANPVVGFLVFSLCSAGPLVALAWVVTVDRSTVAGAVEHGEESVESSWYAAAAQGSLADVVVVSGLGCAVLTLSQIEVSGAAALAVVVVVAVVSMGLRYLLAQYRHDR